MCQSSSTSGGPHLLSHLGGVDEVALHAFFTFANCQLAHPFLDGWDLVIYPQRQASALPLSANLTITKTHCPKQGEKTTQDSS